MTQNITMTSTVSTIVNTTINSVVKETLYEIVDDGYSGAQIWIPRVIEGVMWRLGVDVKGTGKDRLVRSYRDGGMYPTLVGELLIWSDEDKYRRPSRLPEEGEVVVSYGDPHYAYFRIAPANPRIDDDLADEIHRQVVREVTSQIKEVMEQEASRRRDWGRRMNASLMDAGCSTHQAQAWWGMHWKREVSPAEWARLLNDLSPDQVAYGLEATGHRYLKLCGIDLGRSFPRSMDIVYALGKAHGVKGKRLPREALRKKEGVDIPPSRMEGGAMVWSF